MRGKVATGLLLAAAPCEPEARMQVSSASIRVPSCDTGEAPG